MYKIRKTLINDIVLPLPYYIIYHISIYLDKNDILYSIKQKKRNHY